MDIVDYVYNTLSPLNIPVKWQLRPADYPSITYTIFLSQGNSYGDGAEKSIVHYLQADVWSKSDYYSLVNNIKLLMLNAGFNRMSESDDFESSTQVYHKILKFNYVESEEIKCIGLT